MSSDPAVATRRGQRLTSPARGGSASPDPKTRARQRDVSLASGPLQGLCPSLQQPTTNNQQPTTNDQLPMRFQQLLSKLHPIKGFVYGPCRLENDTLTCEILARKNSQPRCKDCGNKGPCYDHLKTRTFDFIPFWGLIVVFVTKCAGSIASTAGGSWSNKSPGPPARNGLATSSASS